MKTELEIGAFLKDVPPELLAFTFTEVAMHIFHRGPCSFGHVIDAVFNVDDECARQLIAGAKFAEDENPKED